MSKNSEHKIREAVKTLVERGKEAFSLQQLNEVNSFESPVWTIKHIQDRTISTNNTRLLFMKAGSTKDELPETYAAVIKSWLTLNFRLSARGVEQPLNAARVL